MSEKSPYVFRAGPDVERWLATTAAGIEAVEFAPNRFRKTVMMNGLKFTAMLSRCIDCGEAWPSCPVVLNWIWSKAAALPPRAVSCVPCLEKRLGRALVYQDLKLPTHSKVNRAHLNTPAMPDDAWEVYVEHWLGGGSDD